MEDSARTAIITGGNGALGSAVIQKFALRSANLVLPVREASSLDHFARSYPADKQSVAVTDLEEESSVASLVTQAVRKFGRIDHLVNIVGGYAGGSSIDKVTLQEWERMIAVNLRTAFLVCRAVLPVMRQQSYGRIVNIAAMTALMSGAKKGPYAISKRAVISLTETIADETKGTGITANALAPGTILTEANKQSMPDADFSKWVTPEEIADLILYLCSDQARSVSGNVIKIYGGV